MATKKSPSSSAPKKPAAKKSAAKKVPAKKASASSKAKTKAQTKTSQAQQPNPKQPGFKRPGFQESTARGNSRPQGDASAKADAEAKDSLKDKLLASITSHLAASQEEFVAAAKAAAAWLEVVGEEKSVEFNKVKDEVSAVAKDEWDIFKSEVKTACDDAQEWAKEHPVASAVMVSLASSVVLGGLWNALRKR